MKPEEYILESLSKLQAKGATLVPEADISSAIFKLLMSKKFRKYAVTPGYEEHILSAIKINIANNEPIKLAFVFGGYKLWRLAESPEVDWAELFSLIYFAKWLKPIAEIYEPGVWFDFYSDDVILEFMDNVPKADTEAYIQSFRQLLSFVKPYLPKNLSFTLNRVGDQYENYESFLSDLNKCIGEVKDSKWEDLVLTTEQMRLVELNVRLKSGQADDSKWREKVFLIHEGYSIISKRRPYYRTPDKIMLSTRLVKNTISIGTTKKSVAKFWIGAGVLEKRGDSFIENIYSPNQLGGGHFVMADIHIDGLEGKNFGQIRLA